VIVARAPAPGGLRAFAGATLAVAVAGAALSGTAIERGLRGDGPAASRGAVGQVVPTASGAIAVGTVTARGPDTVRISVTVTNERAAPLRVDPSRFRLLLPGGREAAPAGAVAPAGSLRRLSSATLVLRFRAAGAARARALELRSPGTGPAVVDLRRVVVGGSAAGRPAPHG
jgi:hypothetical protein